MQSDKGTKKTRKSASEPAAAASIEKSAAKPKSSTPSKSEAVETTSAKRHRKAATVSVPESFIEQPVSVSAPKVMAAAAGGNTTTSIVIDPVGIDAASASISHERVQELAYQYWLKDGKPHGNQDEHWLRAERELGLVR